MFMSERELELFIIYDILRLRRRRKKREKDSENVELLYIVDYIFIIGQQRVPWNSFSNHSVQFWKDIESYKGKHTQNEDLIHTTKTRCDEFDGL